jgi:hypothetical protein
VFLDRVLRSGLFEEHFGESGELLQGVNDHDPGSSDQSSPNAAASRFDWQHADRRRNRRDFALAECGRRWRILAAQSSRFVSASLFPPDLNHP